ncbi:MAG: hypothetical protein ACOYLV_11000 [Rubrivivax sp.]
MSRLACPARPARFSPLAWLAPLALSACATWVAYGPGELRTGQPRAAVLASMGPASLELLHPGGGVRLVYARGPMGRETYMVDLDAAGRVTAWHQALGTAQFERLQPGLSREALLFELGPPAERRPAGWAPGEVWSWRYHNNDCLWFQAGLDEQGRYTGGGYGIDPRCDAGDKVP